MTKFNAAGSALVYSTFLGGISPSGIAVDSAGDTYVTGSTYGAPPLKNAFQATAGGGGDAFVTKLNASGSALVYSTYLGGTGEDSATGIALDGSVIRPDANSNTMFRLDNRPEIAKQVEGLKMVLDVMSSTTPPVLSPKLTPESGMLPPPMVPPRP